MLSGVFVARIYLHLTVITPNFKHSTSITGQVLCTNNYVLLTDSSSILPPSQREFPLFGLNLMRLLTQNRIADFHTALESLRLPPDEAYENPFIKHPVNVERWLMEGSYSKVWNAREEAPLEEYKYFVDSLMGTIRSV